MLRKFVIAGGLIVVAVAAGAALLLRIAGPPSLHWPDRRPIGALFLASDYHSSPANPRGWFNNRSMDVTGPEGAQRFRQALLDYTDRSVAILRRTGAQGAIVWDLEGEQYPHKTSYIGDPRALSRLAPEMDAVADEFFGRLRSAGLRVGLTIRPQQLVFNGDGQPQQVETADEVGLLLNKIDYARKRWGATLFYVDSNRGIRSPGEVARLRQVAEQRPDVLLIPEHHDPLYQAFSAPYVGVSRGDSAISAGLGRLLFPGSFRALNISDAPNAESEIAAATKTGDVIVFRAWFRNRECVLLEDRVRESPR